MRMTRTPSLLAIAVVLALGSGAAAASDPSNQSPPVHVIRGPEIDSFGNPIADPSVSATQSVKTKGGSVLVLRGAPSPLPSAAMPRQAPLNPAYASATGGGFYGVGAFDGRRSDRGFHGHGTAGRHGVQGTTTPSTASVPNGRRGAFDRHRGGFGGQINGFGGANSGLGGFSGGFGGSGGVGGFRR